MTRGDWLLPVWLMAWMMVMLVSTIAARLGGIRDSLKRMADQYEKNHALTGNPQMKGK